MGVLLIGGEWSGNGLAFPIAKVAEQQVVRIVPSAWPRELVQFFAGVDVESIPEQTCRNAFKTSAKVSCGPPTLTSHLFPPFPDAPHAILTQVKHKVTVLSSQDIANHSVRFLQISALRVLGN